LRQAREKMTQNVFTLPSFAKINLSLRVLGRSADGYHEIRTVFQTITLADEITFEVREDERFELICDDPNVPTDETNLITRAARLLKTKSQVSSLKSQFKRGIGSRESGSRRSESASGNQKSKLHRLVTWDLRLGTSRGARVTLRKRIPVGGGLGGGSSNAATALIGLAHLWRIEISLDELMKLGAELGADVPFFFAGGTAFGAGRGADIRPLADAPPQELIIITPPVHVSTAEAYKSLNAPALTNETAPIILKVSDADAALDRLMSESVRNDFEAPIFKRYPQIQAAHEALAACGARRAMLSGSGASVFGVFDNQVARDEACAMLRRENERKNLRWRIFSCATLARQNYVCAFGDLLPERAA
jgi:4-diphosphocytidyl-2-C-methyl-D-erythritol kinase